MRLLRSTPLVTLLAALACLTLGLTACTGKEAVGSAATGAYRFSGATAKGQLIPEADRKSIGSVSATLLGGGDYNFDQLKGKVVLVNFYASWCVPCQSETPQLAALYTEEKPLGVQFLGVATKESSTSAASEFAKDMGITYPVIYDQLAKVPLQIGNIPMRGLPMTVLLDKEHRVAAVYPQQVLPADLQPSLTTLLAEK